MSLFERLESCGYFARMMASLESKTKKMMTKISHGNLTWIDFEKPTPQDIAFLKDKFQLHPLLLDEFTSPSLRPRAEEFENCLYVVMHIPLFNPKTKATIPGEMDIVLTHDHLITSHANENIPIKAIQKEFNENEAVRIHAMSGSSGFLLYFILEKLLSSCFPKIDHINEKLSEIEKEIFEDNDKAMVKETSIVKRDILAFRRTLKPQRSILESLVQKHYNLLEDGLNQYFQDLIGTNIRVWNALENTKEVIESLEVTNNSLVSYKTNQTMRLFTTVSFITFTLAVFVGIFGMVPFEGFSSAKDTSVFWLVITAMLLIIIGLLAVFRRKKYI